MFGSSENLNGFGTFSGPNGSGSMFSSGNTAWVSGTNGHDGMCTRVGNTVFGPNGVSTVMGSGPIKTIFGPNGVSTVMGSGPIKTVFGPEGMSTVMGSGNIHTVHGPDGSTGTFFGNVPF